MRLSQLVFRTSSLIFENSSSENLKTSCSAACRRPLLHELHIHRLCSFGPRTSEKGALVRCSILRCQSIGRCSGLQRVLLASLVVPWEAKWSSWRVFGRLSRALKRVWVPWDRVRELALGRQSQLVLLRGPFLGRALENCSRLKVDFDR